ncbi:MAG TPA: ferritin [Phycisphaerae bacterium]|nr:ferritin [Phycisphaerae bacterium]HNU44988.1 ferritin [Phycisphaerae bacterium]
MAISKTMNGKINSQITAEFSASQMYLGMGLALNDMGLKVLARLFEEQAAEEREHALKFIHYVQEVNGEVKLDATPAQPCKYGSLKDVAKAALDAELKVTAQINDLVAQADEEKDHATHHFLMWFVDEQVEEVSKFRDLLQLVELAGPHVLRVEARVQQLMNSKS